MKTTLDLPDDVLVAARKKAAEEQRTLSDLVEQSLRTALAGTTARRRPRRAIAWVTVEGGLPPGVDPSDRNAMHDRLRRRS